MSHCSGDWQAFINAGVWAIENACPVALKLSQRFVPAHPDFRSYVLDALSRKSAVIPGRMGRMQIARPIARFYTKFPVLTDCVAWKVEKFMPSDMMNTYKERFTGGKPTAGTALVEAAWHDAILRRFKDDAVISHELANHVPLQPKLFLRKAQSSAHEYQMLASEHGFKGNFDVREWSAIEGKQYQCRPQKV